MGYTRIFLRAGYIWDAMDKGDSSHGNQILCHKNLCIFFFRSIFDRLFHRYDFLWNPCIFPRSCHWSISGIGRNDPRGPTVSSVERSGDRYHGFSVFLGYLLLRYYRMDHILYDSHVYTDSSIALGYLR